MQNRLRIIINIFMIIFMPFMMYINISSTKVNIAMADIMLVLVGILFLINIKQFFIQKRWIYLLYFGGLLLSLLVSQYISRFNENISHVGNSVMIMEMIKTLVVTMYFFIGFIFIKNERDYRLSLIAVSLSSIPVMIIGLTSYIYFLLGKEFFIEVYRLEILRFQGSFEDPNLCAIYIIFILFVSLLNLKVQKNKYMRFLLIGVILLSLITIFLTMSRGGWLGLTGAMVVFLLLNIRNLKKEHLLVFISLFIILFISIDLDYYFQQGKITKDMVSRVQDSLIIDINDIDRVQLMRAAFLMGNDNFFFGVAKGGFPLNSYMYLPEDSVQATMNYIPHNTILGFYAQQGIVGVLIFIILPCYVLYRMIRYKSNQSLYFIPLFIGLFIHSMTINIENVRFLWYFLGLVLAGEEMNINLDFISATRINKKTFAIVISISLLLLMFFCVDISRKLKADIYVHKGEIYERRIPVSNLGNYEITFDIQTDNHLHTVEVYDDQQLVKSMNFKSAYGVVHEPIKIKKECYVIFRSHEDGWMKVKNAYITRGNERVPLYDYILLPRFMEDWYNNRGFLVYSYEPSFKNQISIENNKFDAFEILDEKVIRYSNLSHVFQFIIKSKRSVDIIYLFDLLLEYNSISNLLPNEYQRNLWPHRFTLAPHTSKWEVGQKYTIRSTRLFTSEAFNLYGRYYDYVNGQYTQESYFPIQYDLVKERQDIIELGESQWVNINYYEDNESIIHMANNGWVESGRMNLELGDYEIKFMAQGSSMEEYPKVRFRDSFFNEIAEIVLDGTMKEYTVKYHVDEPKEGMSFILEIINYKSEKDVGSRKVLLKDWLKVSKVN